MTVVLRIQQLKHRYAAARELALGGLDITLAAGEALGIVGESGCGKSTLARAATRLLRPLAGTIEIAGRDWAQVPQAQLKPLYRHIQLVFQDPAAALSPRRTVFQTLSEPLMAFGLCNAPQIAQRVAQLLVQVGLDPDLAVRLPHQLSGGQRQRVMIARALAVQPSILVADEPLAALDVSVQAQMMNLFKRLQQELNLALLFISHDLSVVSYLCQRIAVMYRGRIVELGPVAELLDAPRHPYTRSLLAAAERALHVVPMNQLQPVTATGCAYRANCAQAVDICARQAPLLRKISSRPSHTVSCHLDDLELE